jgi:hypothetical protein
MNHAKGIVAAAIVVIALASGGPVEAQSIKGREILGVRLGGLQANGAFNSKFGGGSEIEIHFIHGLADWFGVDVALSSHNFGASRDQDKNLEFFDRTDVNLQIFSLSAGMVLFRMLHGRYMPTIEAGPGFYSVNAILPAGFYEAQKTDNHLGVYAGVGLLFRLANTVSLDANVKYHAVFVGTKPDDTVHFYTDESTIRFLQITVGVMISTG